MDAWTIAKGLLLYTAVVMSVLLVLTGVMFAAAALFHRARLEKVKSDLAEWNRKQAESLAKEVERNAERRRKFEESPLGKAARDTEGRP